MSQNLPVFRENTRPDLCCGHTISHAAWPRKYLPLLGLIYVVRGRGRMHSGDRVFDTRQDMLLLLKANAELRFEALEEWDLYWFHFLMTPRQEQIADWPEEIPGLSAIQLPEGNFVLPMLESALWLELTRPKYWDETIFSLLDSAIRYGRTRRSDSVATGDARILQAKELLSGTKELSMDELARRCGMSRTRLFAKFKEKTGMSPRSYRELVMMKKARRMLEDPDFSVAEIAGDVGMKSCSYFSTRFRHIFGVSPQQYRRELERRGETAPAISGPRSSE